MNYEKMAFLWGLLSLALPVLARSTRYHQLNICALVI